MKTIEEAALEYGAAMGNPQKPINATYDGFKSGVEFAQRWIPVEEDLPISQGHYFVKCKTSFPKNCDVVVAEFYEDNNTFYSESGDHPIKDATHWRPIELK